MSDKMQKMDRRAFLTTAAAAFMPLPTRAHETPELGLFSDNDNVREFIAETANKHGFAHGDLAGLFAKIKADARVIQLMDAPAEKKVYWRAYRKSRLGARDIDAGIRFVRNNKTTLKRAEEKYGVPPGITAAILGVETRYGAILGNFPVMQSLATLAFYYPRRANEFRRQLREFLLYARENNIRNPLALRGSYAGAFGMPQFLPSSARKFADDFDNDGRIDLFATEDAVGSIGKFLQGHGWQRAHGVMYALSNNGDTETLLAAGRARDYKATFSRDEFAAAGAVLQTEPAAADEKYLMVNLENRYDTEYRAGTGNFYALTRYNKSFKYAAAVADLAAELSRGLQD